MSKIVTEKHEILGQLQEMLYLLEQLERKLIHTCQYEMNERMIRIQGLLQSIDPGIYKRGEEVEKKIHIEEQAIERQRFFRKTESYIVV